MWVLDTRCSGRGLSARARVNLMEWLPTLADEAEQAHTHPLGDAWLVAFAGLYRFLDAHRQAVQTALSTVFGARAYDRLRQAAATEIETVNGLCRLLRSEPELEWTHAAGLLSALDGLLSENASTHRSSVELGDVLGEYQGRHWVVSDAANPWAESITRKRRLTTKAERLDTTIQHVLTLTHRAVRAQHGAITLAMAPLEATVDDRLFQRGLDLRIGLSCGPIGVEYDFSARKNGLSAGHDFYRFSGVTSASRDAALESLIAICTEAAEAKVDVLVFPELSLDVHLQGELVSWLKANAGTPPWMVVAGSFHHEIANGPIGFENRTQVYSGAGDLLWTHTKCAKFKIPAEESTPAVCELLGIRADRGGEEDIQLANVLHVLDGQIGRIVTPICIDYFCEDLRAPFLAAGVTVVLSPTMSPTLQRFEKRANTLGDHARAWTFVANSRWVCDAMGVKSPVHALRYAPHRGGLQRSTFAPDQGLLTFSIRELLDLDSRQS